MASREDFQKRLEEFIGSKNVYFQPPESFKINYPCIIYELDFVRIHRADNKAYNQQFRYAVTYVSAKPRLDMVTRFAEEFELCAFDRAFKADGLYHYIFNIYY